mmetsp:Transcript_2661/g.9666  ORF Transcript_2661/g.9666 Transcript_2661/m.9666 type:complete len:329 (+) Transcript_2661:61-1047(+)
MSSHGHQLRRSSSALGLDSITPNSAHVGGHSSTAPAPAFWRSKRTLPPPFRTIVSWTRVALHWCRRHARPGASAPPRQLHQRRVQCCAAPLGLPVSSAKQVLDESFYHKIESQAAHGFDDGVPWSVSQMHAQEYDIYFRFICPSGWNKTTDGFGAPLLVLHGGPGVPHDYLLPLHALATDSRRRPRPVLFFDQVGCGLSSKPDLVAYPYSIRQSIREVELAMRVLEDKTGMRARDIHIYGQSWGGILAFEYILLGSPVRSLTISNSPADVHLVEAEADRIIASIDPEKMPMAFLERHQCRDQGNVYLRSAMDKVSMCATNSHEHVMPI